MSALDFIECEGRTQLLLKLIDFGSIGKVFILLGGIEEAVACTQLELLTRLVAVLLQLVVDFGDLRRSSNIEQAYFTHFTLHNQ